MQIIPKKHHSKYTIRERGGYDHLTELPPDLTTLIKGEHFNIIKTNSCFEDLCLESVNLLDPRTEDDKERREELGENIYRFMKFAL